MKPHALATCAAFVGRDWAEATHALGLQAAGTERREVLGLQHRPEALEAWGQPLRTRVELDESRFDPERWSDRGRFHSGMEDYVIASASRPA